MITINNKKLILPTIALGVLIAAGAVGIGVTKADDTEGYPSIVERLVEQFGLDQGEVEAVFDSVRDEKHEMMRTSMEKKLSEAVIDGVLTEEQKQALLDKKAEMFADKEAFEGKTGHHKGEYHEEMVVWFEEQGIDQEALMGYMRSGEHKGFGNMHGFNK